MAHSLTCAGFKAGAIASGLKKNGNKDLGLIFSQVPAAAAGVFTRNTVQAAPVRLDRERIKSGCCQAIIVNSGNANCCTGEQGMRDAAAMTHLAASALGISQDLVLAASTGVIGEPLPIEKIKAAIGPLVDSLSPDGLGDLARAIMTTDLIPKTVLRQGSIDGNAFTVVGVAKGSGMIHPDMATMLCFVCTDIGMPAGLLQEALLTATERSFNRITVDGDTSTNDTVLVMANGLSRARIQTTAQIPSFQSVLDDVLLCLAKMVAKDGEGATKLVEICVKGALTDKDAHKIADTVANSNLVKTAFFGEDANWGRIVAAAGRANVSMDPDRIDVFFNDVQMVKNGTGCGKTAEAEATNILKTPEFIVCLDLKMGDGKASVFTCDFSIDYVKINADYRS